MSNSLGYADRFFQHRAESIALALSISSDEIVDVLTRCLREVLVSSDFSICEPTEDDLARTSHALVRYILEPPGGDAVHYISFDTPNTPWGRRLGVGEFAKSMSREMLYAMFENKSAANPRRDWQNLIAATLLHYRYCEDADEHFSASLLERIASKLPASCGEQNDTAYKLSPLIASLASLDNPPESNFSG